MRTLINLMDDTRYATVILNNRKYTRKIRKCVNTDKPFITINNTEYFVIYREA